MNKILASLVLVSLAGACNKAPTTATPTPTAAPPAKVAGAATKIAIGQKTNCPVTGEEFVVSDKTAQVEHKGKYYAFCCPDCQPTFEKNPTSSPRTRSLGIQL